jgi:hypothetical protein
MTKVICDLRKILHKAQVRLTKAGVVDGEGFRHNA